MIIVNRINPDSVVEEGIAARKILSVNPDLHKSYCWIKYWDGDKVSSFKIEESVREVAAKMLAARGSAVILKG